MATECAEEPTILRAKQSQAVVVVSDGRGRMRCVSIDEDIADEALRAQQERLNAKSVVDRTP